MGQTQHVRALVASVFGRHVKITSASAAAAGSPVKKVTAKRSIQFFLKKKNI